MRPRLLVMLALALACSGSMAAQTPSAPDGVGALLDRLRVLLEAGNRDGFVARGGTTLPADQIEQFSFDLFQPGVQRAVVNTRDRAPLEGSLPGDGFRLRCGVL